MWYDGPPSYVAATTPYGTTAVTAGVNVGYWGDQSKSSPEVGQIYTAHIVAGVFNTWRVNSFFVQLGVLLPQGTSFYFAPGQPLFLCRKQPMVPNTTAVDVTLDPGSLCPSAPPGLLTNGYFDLSTRAVAANTYFEIVFELISLVELAGERLRGYLKCSDGEAACEHPVLVYSKPPGGPPSAQLSVVTIPTWIANVGVPYSFAIFSRDSGSFATVGGTATIFNFDQQGNPFTVQFPTNTPQVATFYYGHSSLPDGSILTHVPHGVVNCPGYQQRDFPIPFKFSTF